MSVVGLILILLLLAAAAWFVNTSAKATPTFKTILNVVLVVIALLLCMVAFGVWDEIRGMKVPKI